MRLRACFRSRRVAGGTLLALALSGCASSSDPPDTAAPPSVSVEHAQPPDIFESDAVEEEDYYPDGDETRYPSYDDLPEPSDEELQADIDAKVDAQITEACADGYAGPPC
jgi:hypothetical protein